METEQDNNSIKRHVSDAIKTGDLLMRPRWHFILQTVFAVVGAFTVLLMILYLVSFIFSSLHESGVWFVPAFGSEGWFELFATLPWILVFTAIFFTIFLEILVNRFSFGHRQPILYTVVGIIILVLFGSIIAEPFHREVFRAAHDQDFPIFGGFYRYYGAPHLSNTHVGFIYATTSEGFTLENRDDEMLNIVVGPKTSFPLGVEFEKGDIVIVFGNRINDTIQAQGIREVNSEFATSTRQIQTHGVHQRFRFQLSI